MFALREDFDRVCGAFNGIVFHPGQVLKNYFVQRISDAAKDIISHSQTNNIDDFCAIACDIQWNTEAIKMTA